MIVELYTSSATGMLKIKKDQAALKFLLEAKKIQYIEYDVASDTEKREKMKKSSGVSTLPQLFINDVYAGDYDHLAELEENNEFITLFQNK
ncbi:hypothetical protein CYY_001792 [Polysphondylium violaceum]|uniref:Glutaredoxin n=1 Tax=Polysphondylium violaceum TaxID=133409 RepID=A0A8J4VA87_9MYCE|nr:hypothetical protein CYY_001792 [Polysphondylium violaceum]